VTAVLPVAVAIGGGEQIAALQAAGMLLAVAGSALTTAEPGGRGVVRGAGLGLCAALCFGAFFVLLGEAGETGGPAAVLAGRVASVAALVLVVAARAPQGRRVERRDGVAIGALGALDVAANLAYAGAALHGTDATVAVLASLYPLTTVLLARALLHERIGGTRLAGVVAVLGGVGLISASAA
jgi:drug/metabolite transporter (DMT)-like permease